MSAKKLNLPLAPEMHEALFAESRSLGIPATKLARRVLEEWLRERRRKRLRQEIRRFALAAAGSRADLDPELEASAVEELGRLDTAEE